MGESVFDRNQDPWYDWLTHQRTGGDENCAGDLARTLQTYAKRVIDGADLAPDAVLLDIGSGEGLVPFHAIARLGPDLRVVFSDTSDALLRHAQGIAEQSGVLAQCDFIQTGADDLKAIPDASVDAVTTRSSLAYVADKAGALAEFYRVLKPGGVLSSLEPIFQDTAFEVIALKDTIDRAPAPAGLPSEQLRQLKILHAIKSAQFPDTREKLAADAMTNFNERDLVRLAAQQGFASLHMELHIDIAASYTSWQLCLDGRPHPYALSMRDVMTRQFSPDECELLTDLIKHQVGSGKTIGKTVMAHLVARKSR